MATARARSRSPQRRSRVLDTSADIRHAFEDIEDDMGVSSGEDLGADFDEISANSSSDDDSEAVDDPERWLRPSTSSTINPITNLMLYLGLTDYLLQYFFYKYFCRMKRKENVVFEISRLL